MVDRASYEHGQSEPQALPRTLSFEECADRLACPAVQIAIGSGPNGSVAVNLSESGRVWKWWLSPLSNQGGVDRKIRIPAEVLSPLSLKIDPCSELTLDVMAT